MDSWRTLQGLPAAQENSYARGRRDRGKWVSRFQRKFLHSVRTTTRVDAASDSRSPAISQFVASDLSMSRRRMTSLPHYALRSTLFDTMLQVERMSTERPRE